MNNKTKNCKVCDKVFKKKNGNNHSKSKIHIGLSTLVVKIITVETPEFMNIDNILKKIRV